MNKLLTTATSALVLTLAAANIAEARDGFYIAARGGYSDYNLNDKDDGSMEDSRLELGGSWNASGALGYKYKYFRVEAEYTYRGDLDEHFAEDYTNQFDVSVSSDSFMLNAYLDVMPNYWISPYLSGGIGITRLKVDQEDSGGLKDNWDEENFTWSVGGGISLRLNRCTNFDFGYRYMDMEELYFGEFTTHEWYAGLRYTF